MQTGLKLQQTLWLVLDIFTMTHILPDMKHLILLPLFATASFAGLVENEITYTIAEQEFAGKLIYVATDGAEVQMLPGIVMFPN